MKRNPFQGFVLFLLGLCLGGVVFGADGTVANGSANLVNTPPPGGLPVKIEGGVYFLNLVSVDEKAQTFTADIYLNICWKDTRLASKLKNGEAAIPAVYIEAAAEEKLKEIWWPHLEFVNASQPDITNRYISIQPDGTVNYQLGLTAEFRGKFNFHTFPFDRQDLPVRIQSFLFEKDVVIFVPDKRKIGVSQDASYDDLQFDGVTVRAVENLLNLQAGNEHYSELEATLHVKRNFDHYIWQVMLPLLLILSISWSVFFIPSDAVGDRISISLTCLLAGIAFQFAVTANLPSISYTTVLDRVFTLSYLCIAFGVAVSVIENAWHRKDKACKHRLNKAARWMMPLLFLLGMAYLLSPVLRS